MAAARQKEIKASMAVVATNTLGRLDRWATAVGCEMFFEDIEVLLIKRPLRRVNYHANPPSREHMRRAIKKA
jgi:hypothetical protein